MKLSDDGKKLLQVSNEDVRNGQFIIPGTVTNIDTSAFRGCTSLTHITIPDSVESISPRAFENCSSLQVIAFDDKDDNEYQRIVNGAMGVMERPTDLRVFWIS
jgi:hypothetical protein